jgi:hypothetical protein
MKKKDKPEQPQVAGGQHSEISIGSVRVFVAPKEWPPFLADALAEEEDTYLVLSADPEVQQTREQPEELMAELLKTKPAVPGSVIVKEGPPLSLLAVVHDLNQEPSWKEEWIASALDRIFWEAERRKLRSITLPMLGTLHGSFEKQRFLVLLREALERSGGKHLARLWLVVPAGTTREVLGMLASISSLGHDSRKKDCREG